MEWIILGLTIVNTIWLIFLSKLVVKSIEPEVQETKTPEQPSDIPLNPPDYTQFLNYGDANFDGITPVRSNPQDPFKQHFLEG